MTGASLLNHSASPEAHFSHTGLIDLRQLVLVNYYTARREIRSLDIPHQFFIRKIRIFEQGDLRVDDLRQVVRRRVGRHSYSNAFRSIDQEIRDLNREYFRFFLVLVEVWNKINNILIEVRQKGFFRYLLKARLGITHGRRAVSLNIAEISMPVDQGDLFFEILRHDDQRVVDRAVSMGMIFTHCIADYSGALSEGSVRADPELMHIVESPSLYGFEPVPDIRERPRDDNAHRVVDIGFLHQFGILSLEDLLLRSLRKSIFRQSLPFSAVLVLVVFRHIN